MSKTSFIDLTPELEPSFFSGLQHVDRFNNARLRPKNVLLSRKVKKNLSEKSLLPTISSAWSGLSDLDKLAWSAAGAVCGLNGWLLFVQDFSARQLEGLAGLATPSLLHQSYVGQIYLFGEATEIKLVQSHSQSYSIYQKVVGKKSMFSPVVITEQLTLPFNLSINYSSNLTIAGPNPFAKIYARFWYSFEGQNLYYDLEIPFDLVSGWKNANVNLSVLNSYVISYEIFIHCHDLQGYLFFDNIKATHGSQNWAFDSNCNFIEQKFSGNFYLVPDNWSQIPITPLAEYGSVYKDF